MPLFARGTDSESPDEYDDARRVAFAFRLTKLVLGVVAPALTVAKLPGALRDARACGPADRSLVRAES